MSEDLVYSIDGERFYHLDEVMKTLKGDYEPGKHKIKCGTPKKLHHSEFINGDHLVESIQESCFDEHGEYAEDYLSNLKDGDIKELEQLIANFLTKKVGDIKFFSVENIKTVEVSTE